MTTETERPTMPNRDGCDCPRIVARCAHFGTEGVFLNDRDGTEHKPDCFRGDFEQLEYFVAPLSALESCPDCGAPDAGINIYNAIILTEDYDAALAALHEAEERLRGEQ